MATDQKAGGSNPLTHVFKKATRDIQIEKFVGEALSGESDNFKKRLISVLANLTADEWELLEQKAKELVGMNDE